METHSRRKSILEILDGESQPVAGSELANRFSVSRQIIVQDVSILRALGEQILATPRGYILVKNQAPNLYRKTFATCHLLDEMRHELEIMVDAGGKVVDVIVEHPIYGELKGMLMVGSRRDVAEFMSNIKSSNSKPLSALTDGVHLHTVEAASEEVFPHIEDALSRAGYLIESNN